MEKRPFSGDVVDYYARFRRGFPRPVADAIGDALGLAGDDVLVDLGCGTGQLTLPLAGRVRAAIGVDAEPDMLARARDTAQQAQVSNISWVLGTDRDLPALGAALGGSLGAVTVATAIHLMDHERLFQQARSLVRPGGTIAVVANGRPVWLYDTPWSAAVRECLFDWFDTDPADRTAPNQCGTDPDSRAAYRQALVAARFAVDESVVEYAAELSLEELVGNLFSALGAGLPTPAQRLELAQRIREAVAPEVRFTEPVRVATLIGRVT